MLGFIQSPFVSKRLRKCWYLILIIGYLAQVCCKLSLLVWKQEFICIIGFTFRQQKLMSTNDFGAVNTLHLQYILYVKQIWCIIEPMHIFAPYSIVAPTCKDKWKNLCWTFLSSLLRLNLPVCFMLI